jgi:acetyltransferase-like isoleucine patch superfamily enzyme
MTNNFSPVALFVFDRPDHTERTIHALRKAELAEESILFIFADGPRNYSSKEEMNRVERVRKIIEDLDGFKEVVIVKSDVNKGLASSIIDGVTTVVDKFGRVIVLEDDIIVSKGFLKYCNEALDLYSNDEEVMHISASNYDANFDDLNDTFFVKALSCQGWATWKRAWDLYNDDALDHLTFFQTDPIRSFKFDIEGSAYFMKQLKKNVSGELNTWAVKWYASWLRAGGISLFPKKSLLFNIGFDGSGENSGKGKSYIGETIEYLKPMKIPIFEDEVAREKIRDFWRSYLGVDKTENKYHKVSKNLQSQIESRFKIFLRKVFRRLIIFTFPELSPIFTTQFNLSWSKVLQTIHGSNISNLSKIYPPGTIKFSKIGRYTYIAAGHHISFTEIGNFCSIGPNFICGWGIHPTEFISTSPMFYSTQEQNGTTLSQTNKVQERHKITIGNDVFIGMNVTVLDGITIGDGAVIGAGCVVSKNVPPFAVVVGSPMKVLRYRFDESTRNKLISIKWWDWTLEELKNIEELFFDTESFVARYSKS